MSTRQGILPLILFAMVLVRSVNAFGGVDLRITDDGTYKRPNAWSSLSGGTGFLYAEAQRPASRPGISIAWRNANQVEEVEVRVQNLGDEPGEGKLFVEVLDEVGKVLLLLEPPDEFKTVRVPAADKGGREGKIIRMKASWELNAMIDRFDLARTRYGVRATVDTLSGETNWSDNSKVKEWNIPFAVKPRHINVYNYTFKNNSSDARTVRWLWEHTDLPEGWKVDGIPTTAKPFEFKPGDELHGTLMMKAPISIKEGAFLESRLSLVDASNSKVVQQHEWFQVYDSVPPDVSNYRAVLLDDHTLAIQALVADKGSGVLEATGVTTQFSVDGGRTWALKAHNYKVGNFVRPTLFETVLGPFAPGTKVQVRFSAKDTAGNTQAIIPDDSSAFRAPPSAEKLLQNAYVFPRTQKNAVFELEKLKNLGDTLQKLKELKVDIKTMDFTKPNPLGITPDRLKELGLDAQRLADLKEDLIKASELNLKFEDIKVVPLNRVKSLGEGVLQVSTLEFTVP